MEPADARRDHYAARRKRLFFDQAGSRRFFIQPNVRAVLVVVADVFVAESKEVGLVQRDHVIQHLATYALDPSFGNAVLPGAPKRRPNGIQSAIFQKCFNVGANLLSWSKTM